MASSLGFQTPVDVANRALQHCRIPRIAAFTDSSAGARETGFVYDKLREAELRCNLWRFATKRTIIRPIETNTLNLATSADTPSGAVLPFASTAGATLGPVFASNGNIASNTTVLSFTSTSITLSQNILGDIPGGTAITFGPQTLLWTPPTYSAATTYSVGQIVADANGEWWQSKVSSNLANTPVPGAKWQHYTGPDALQPWNTQVSYFTGELTLASNSNVYMSLSSRNTGKDPTTTSGFWLLVNGTTTPLAFFYPIGTGPGTDTTTPNVFRLPHGFLRQCPSDPKAGASVWLGAAHGNIREDWVFEDDYIVSMSPGPLMLRYVQNTVDVPVMDPMFCEMLAARIAEEVAPTLTAPDMLPNVLQIVRGHYRDERYKAVSVNGIEIGPIDQDLDDYLACRN